MSFTTAEDESGLFEAVLSFISNDPDQENYPINLRARTLAPPTVQVMPDHVHAFTLENDVEEREIVLSNQGETTLRFQLEAELVQEPERLRRLAAGGPRRDQPGQVLRTFVPPGGAAQHYNIGLAWDEENRWMWNNDFHNARCYALDPADDFQQAREFGVMARCMSIALLDGQLYMVVDPQTYLAHYDREGNRLDNVQLAYTPFAVTAGADLERLIVMGSDGSIHVLQMTEEGAIERETGIIRTWQPSINNRACRSMLWVDLHPEGSLWFQSTTGPNAEPGNHAWQFAVDTEAWTLGERQQVFRSRSTAGGAAQHWDGLGHDGQNLWASYWATAAIQIMDDGVREIDWLTISPRRGELEGGEETGIGLGFNSAGQVEGEYRADLLIHSNDPVNPVVQVPIVWTVGSVPLVHFGPDIEEPFIETETFHTLTVEALAFEYQPLPSGWGGDRRLHAGGRLIRRRRLVRPGRGLARLRRGRERASVPGRRSIPLPSLGL